MLYYIDSSLPRFAAPVAARSERTFAMFYRLVCVSVLASLILVAHVSTADADRYRVYPRAQPRVGIFVYPHGLYFGAGLTGAAVLHRDSATPIGSGGGATLYSGLRLHRSLGLELGWLGTIHGPADSALGDSTEDPWILNGFTADARIYLPASDSHWEPYLQGGFGVYVAGEQNYGELSIGTGFQAGGGFDARIGPHLSAGVRVLYRGLALGPSDSDELDSYLGLITAEGSLSLRF